MQKQINDYNNASCEVININKGNWFIFNVILRSIDQFYKVFHVGFEPTTSCIPGKWSTV